MHMGLRLTLAATTMTSPILGRLLFQAAGMPWPNFCPVSYVAFVPGPLPLFPVHGICAPHCIDIDWAIHPQGPVMLSVPNMSKTEQGPHQWYLHRSCQHVRLKLLQRRAGALHAPVPVGQLHQVVELRA